MVADRFLRPLRVPVVAAVTSPSARVPRLAKCGHFQLWLKSNSVKSQMWCKVPEFGCKTSVLEIFHQYAQKFRISGSKFAIGSVAVCSVIGLASLRPQLAYCADYSHLVGNVPRKNWWRPSQFIESNRRVFDLLQKLLAPIFLFLYVWVNWGKCQPLYFAAKVAAIFISTNPTHSSVYIFIDQLSHQNMSQQPFLYRFRPLQEKAVEVESYIFFSLARVEIRDENRILLGVLGSWWNLPFPTRFLGGNFFLP